MSHQLWTECSIILLTATLFNEHPATCTCTAIHTFIHTEIATLHLLIVQINVLVQTFLAYTQVHAHVIASPYILQVAILEHCQMPY